MNVGAINGNMEPVMEWLLLQPLMAIMWCI
jgi:hypothetical protein